jgi:Bacterial regulatory proteins, gntR family
VTSTSYLPEARGYEGYVVEGDEEHAHWHDEPLRLNPESPAALWLQLSVELRRRIVEWNLPVETPLPTEAELASQYHLSRDTVRQAYQAMMDTGQVKSRQGAGYYVAELVPMQHVQVLPGSKITIPAPDPEALPPDMPWWSVLAIRVEAPGMEPIYLDPTTTTLTVS